VLAVERVKGEVKAQRKVEGTGLRFVKGVERWGGEREGGSVYTGSRE
jgi:hypothetical protein